METTERTTAPRRVGTFTLGMVLVLSGCAMMAALFWPKLDLSWMLKGSPLILVSLGVETLLAARGGEKVRYDWVGMILCFLLVCTALCLYTAAWWMLYGSEHGMWP